MLQNRIALICLALFLLLVPCLAQAQEDTSTSLEERFGGFYLSLDAMVGTGHSCAGYFCGNPDEEGYRSYVLEHGVAHKSLERYFLENKRSIFSFQANVSAGYLFGTGTRLFVGPEITVSTGIPMIINFDARARFLIHLADNHALEASLGVGYSLINLLYETAKHEYINIFIPMQFGYNYTFDNGIMIGVSLQLNLSVLPEKKYQSIETEQGAINSDGEMGEIQVPKDLHETGKMAYISSWGAGIHIGYRFGK